VNLNLAVPVLAYTKSFHRAILVGLLYPEGNTVIWNIKKHTPNSTASHSHKTLILKVYKHPVTWSLSLQWSCLKWCTQLPYILYLWGTHNYIPYQMLQSTHQRLCSLHSKSWIQNQPQDPVPYHFPQSLTPNYGTGTS